jgi:hypothetical protein
MYLKSSARRSVIAFFVRASGVFARPSFSVRSSAKLTPRASSSPPIARIFVYLWLEVKLPSYTSLYASSARAFSSARSATSAATTAAFAAAFLSSVEAEDSAAVTTAFAASLSSSASDVRVSIPANISSRAFTALSLASDASLVVRERSAYVKSSQAFLTLFTAALYSLTTVASSSIALSTEALSEYALMASVSIPLRSAESSANAFSVSRVFFNADAKSNESVRFAGALFFIIAMSSMIRSIVPSLRDSLTVYSFSYTEKMASAIAVCPFAVGWMPRASPIRNLENTEKSANTFASPSIAFSSASVRAGAAKRTE